MNESYNQKNTGCPWFGLVPSANRNQNNTAARIMSTTLKIGNRGGLLVSQLEKKFKLLFSCRNI